MLKKGFIGPVGDDLPSITPLVLGLMIFFTAFTSAFNSFDKRNEEFMNNIELLKISKTIRANSYIYSYENFEQLCNSIGPTRIKYVVGITKDAYEQKEINNFFEINFNSYNGKTFFCTNQDFSSNTTKINDIIKINDLKNFKVASRIYPIVVEEDKKAKPMHLVVIVWK
ncbi:MAG: hypothetical protein QXD98_02290 [Candidatus Diapherotrites archaeon]